LTKPESGRNKSGIFFTKRSKRILAKIGQSRPRTEPKFRAL
jgi:hypothetical protein